MRLTSIESTPNPNSMKLNLDGHRSVVPITYLLANANSSPQLIREVLNVPGIQSVFSCEDFLTINKDPRGNWKVILEAVTKIIPGIEVVADETEEQRLAAESTGQVAVHVQTFRGIPIQVKAFDKQGEKRIALEQRFASTATLLQERTGADYLKERYWANWGVRYGTIEEVAAEVVDEIQGTMPELVLNKLLEDSQHQSQCPTSATAATRADLQSSDWHLRLLAVQELGTDELAIATLIECLSDPHQQVRRMAAAALGATGAPQAVPHLCEVLLNDNSAGVRRTAGDALSDLGDVSAQPSMCLALSDSNRLVRWRAARFLADLGNEDALPHLHKRAGDIEFEVCLEVEAAIARITEGRECSVPVWKKILEGADGS